MLTTDLGACEWFVWDLRRSNLIDRGLLDQVIGEFLSKNPQAEPPQLAEYLVQKNYLTEFQAERLLQGKTQGFVLGPFTLMDALGTGSMGTVYKAQSKTDNKWFAVKVLPRRSMWNVRIARRKVRAFEQCQHPAVVPFVDVGTAGSMHYLAWPMVEGTPLDKYVEQHGKLSAQETARIALQTAEGLAAANAAGLFHGMLKPSNLMLSDDQQVRILDFGIGCLLSETEGESLVDTMSTANSVNSGLDCASPESIMDPSNLSAVGDQYSLGCVMYFCMTGQYPFPDGTAVEKMMAHQTKQPTPIRDINPEVPEDMVAVVERLMQKNPGHRYGDFKEVIEALRPLAQPASAGTGRVTMQMPRIKLSRPIVAEPPSGAPAEPIRPSAMQRPVPPLVRPTSNSNSSPPVRPPSPSGQGGIRPTSPSARGLPQPPARVPSPPVRVTRPPVVEPPLPDSQAEELPQPQVRSYRHPPSPYPPEPAAAQAGYPPQRNGFGLVTVILLALLAGVGAFFLAKLIPF